ICPGARSATGFQLKLEDQQGAGVVKDDTSANGIRMQCPSGHIISVSDQHGRPLRSSWGWCFGSTTICGFQQQVEKPRGLADDTALNGVRILCCDRA
ncbi:hypothetical protein CHLNCDRAFT_21940, partial [Chlorella variabilis]